MEGHDSTVLAVLALTDIRAVAGQTRGPDSRCLFPSIESESESESE